METGNTLNLFVTVVEEGSFSAAGRALGVPTSTVSRQLTRLEDRLGVRLLHRTTRQITPTEIGAAYYERCKRIVSEIAEAEAEVTSLQQTPRGRLRVSAPPSARTLPFVEELVTAFMGAYPEVEVRLSVETRFVDLVAEGVDVALRAGMIFDDSSLIARKLFSSCVGAVASRDYLDEHGRPEAVEDLSRHRCLSSTPRWQVAGGGTIAVRSRLVTNDLSVLGRAVAAGLGIGMLPLAVVATGIADGRIEAVLPDQLSAESTFAVVYPPGRYMSARVRAFVDFTVDHSRGTNTFGVRPVDSR